MPPSRESPSLRHEAERGKRYPHTLNLERYLPETLKPQTLKPSPRSSPVTPPMFRPLGQPETRFSDEKVVNQ
jgi:hypothetical protein